MPEENDLKRSIADLKNKQRKKINETMKLSVPEWDDFEIEIEKLRVSHFVDAEEFARSKNDRGVEQVNMEKRNVYLVMFAIKGFGVGEIELLEEHTPAGVVSDLLEKAFEFSGFQGGITEILVEKKKD